MVSQRFSRSDYNRSALAWTASQLTELRDTPTVCAISGRTSSDSRVETPRSIAPQRVPQGCAPVGPSALGNRTSIATLDVKRSEAGRSGQMAGYFSSVRTQGVGSIRILSFTAEAIRWVQPG
jgi:hypothetical protein